MLKYQPDTSKTLKSETQSCWKGYVNNLSRDNTILMQYGHIDLCQDASDIWACKFGGFHS